MDATSAMLASSKGKQNVFIYLRCAGALNGVDGIFAFHNMPTMHIGTVGSRTGTLMAGTAQFNITMHGRGGHAAIPHGNIDPVPAVSALVAALQVI
jgi:IAA-amino acid hydrolase